MLVQVVVTVVDDVLQNAHNLVGDAVHPNALADRILAGKEFLLGVGSDEGDAGVGEILSFAEGRSLREFHAPHARVDGVHAAHPVAGAARAPGHCALLEDFRRQALEQRHFVADVIQIFDRETDFVSRLGAARLLRGPSGKHEDQVGSEGAEGSPQAALEARAVSQQQHHRGNPPRHAQHGEDAAPLVMAQRAVGLDSEFAEHGYSCLMASTGASSAAFRAG